MRKNMKANKGFTLIELLIVIAVIAILAAIAIPNLLSSRKAANESSAIASLRTVVSAQETFRSRQPSPIYATNLAALAGYIDPVLQGTKKSGYDFLVANATANKYTATAAPQGTVGTTGDRFFFVDESGVIRANSGAAAVVGSSPIQ